MSICSFLYCSQLVLIDEALFLDEIKTAATLYPTFQPHITYSKHEGSLTIEQIETSYRGPLSESEIYMSGPNKMLQHFQRTFSTHGVPSSRIHYEYFDFR